MSAYRKEQFQKTRAREVIDKRLSKENVVLQHQQKQHHGIFRGKGTTWRYIYI